MNNARLIPGIFLIMLGLSALLKFNIWAYVWPVILIYFGVRLLNGRPDASSGGISLEEINRDTIDMDVIFSGVNKKIVSEDFRGGKVTTVFGGGELDLTEVKISDEETVKLEINAVFGGFKIRVPKEWSVTSQIVGVLGGSDNKTRVPKKGEEKGRMVISGSAVLGGVEVVN